MLFKPLHLTILISLLFAVISISQDYIDANRQGSAFYLIESAIFQSFWLLFVPMIWLGKMVIKKLSLPSSVTRSFVILILGVVHFFTAGIIIWGISWVLFDQGYRLLNIYNYFISNKLIILIMAYSFWGLAEFYLFKISKPFDRPEKESFPDKILVKVNKKKILVPVDDILYVKTDRPYLALHTVEGKYLKKTSLKDILNILDPVHFAQIHRTTIIQKKYISHFVSRHNGDYDIHLTDGSVHRVSRTFATFLKD